MHNLVRIVSARLAELDPEEAEAQLAKDEEAERIRTEAAEVAPATPQTPRDSSTSADAPAPRAETPSPPPSCKSPSMTIIIMFHC